MSVGAWIEPSAAVASCVSTAPDCRIRASTGGIGRLRTNAANESMYSGRDAYSSGVKHQGKIPAMTISVVLSRPPAMICQLSTTTRRNGSLACQELCSDSD
jgi:hypothetical protein